MYIVGFNGPPRSGKDTLAEMLANHMDKHQVTLPVKFESLSLPLRHIAHAVVGRTYEESGYEAFKEEWFDLLQSDGRHLMIDSSESFLKQCYGQDVMARLLIQRNLDFEGILLIRDCGFQIEVDTLEEWVGVENLYMRSEDHTSELQSLMRISYAVFCLKNKTQMHIT